MQPSFGFDCTIFRQKSKFLHCILPGYINMKASRLIFTGGLLTGGILGAIGQRVTYRPATKPENAIHIEYQEGATDTRCSALTKYGAPVRSPDISCYSNHSLCYDQSKKIPHWVAEHMTRENIKGDASRKNVKFRSDPTLSPLFAASNSDYYKSGYSRGHMTPAGDNKMSQNAMKDTFYLSNIVPQNYENNAGFWNRFEMYCRDLTKIYANVYVITGPLMMPAVGEDNKTYIKYEVIGENQVAAPTHLYKVIVADNGSSDVPAVGAFIVPNIPLSFDHQLPEYQVPLEKVERYSGFTFVPKLNRSLTRNLCDDNACQLISKEAFRLFIISRRMQSASDLETLEKSWSKIAKENLTPDAYAENVYNRRKEELMKAADQQRQKGS